MLRRLGNSRRKRRQDGPRIEVDIHVLKEGQPSTLAAICKILAKLLSMATAVTVIVQIVIKR
ncbi:MAG: hypothetical protein ACM3ZC_08090 [Bacteroidota bacterium]